jgi:hypothetical protein
MGQYDAGKKVQDFSDRAAAVMDIYSRRHEINSHKMSIPPVFDIPVN